MKPMNVFLLFKSIYLGIKNKESITETFELERILQQIMEEKETEGCAEDILSKFDSLAGLAGIGVIVFLVFSSKLIYQKK